MTRIQWMDASVGQAHMIDGEQHSRVRLVFCVGMRRGGSTLQAQVVSALLGDIPLQAANRDFIQDYLAASRGNGPRSVLKFHEFSPDAAHLLAEKRAVGFYVYRDIRDVVASISRKYGIPPFSFIHGGVLPIVREFEQWTGISGIYVARYEEMIADLTAEVRRLAAHLGVDVGVERASEIACRYELTRQRLRIEKAFGSAENIDGVAENSHDAISLLHKGHIQSSAPGEYKNILRWHEVAALEWVVRDWMRVAGYRQDYSPWIQCLSFSWFELRGLVNKLRRSFGLQFRRRE